MRTVPRAYRLGKEQDKQLAAIAKRTGLTASEHIRRALDLYIAKNAKPKESVRA